MRWCLGFAGALVALVSAAAQPSPSFANSLLDGAKGKLVDVPSPANGADTAYEAALAHLDAAWIAMPLSVKRAIFVTKKASGYGIYDQRPTNEFAPGETLYMYAEPVGYVWTAGEAGTYTFGVIADLALKDAEGNVLSDQPNFANLSLTSHEKNKEFMLSLDLTVTGLKPGLYKVEYKLHDIHSAKTASFSLPFKITGGA